MRKQARRLWFGDWQRESVGGPEHEDRIEILPIDDEDAQGPERRGDNVRRGAILAAIAAVCVLVFALASGGDDEPLTSGQSDAPAQTPQAQPRVPQTQVPQGGQGFGGPDLTDSAAEKAARAALGQYPGEIERVTRDSTGGGYVVHVIQPDGNEVHVLVDGDFHVQGSDANTGPRSGGPGTPQ